MRYLKYLVLAILAALCVVLAIANRGPLTLNLLPAGGAIENFAPDALILSLTLPVYVIVLAAVLLGVVLGLFMEMVRETGHRREERRYKREAAELWRDNQRLKKKLGEEEDDILGPA